MYDMKYLGRRTLKARFKHGVREFVNYAMSRDVVKREVGIRSQCIKCSCVLIIKSPEDVIDHLENVAFMDDYYVWRHHGEKEPKNINVGFMVDTHASSSGVRAECENFGHMEDMAGDALGVNLSYERGGEEEIIPNEKALEFYSMMEEVNKPLFEGSSDSKLSMCVRLLASKSNWNVPEDCLEFFSKVMLDATPVKDNLPKSYYDAKRLVSKLGLEVKKIDCCVQGCMLFYDNEFGTNDGALERLFASMQTASQMTWHYYNKTNSNVMRHPCDGLAWKHFDAVHPDFAKDPLIVTPYNLPPEMCMTKPYMFLSCIIPGPSNPTDGIDVYLQPLIDDLKRLWIGELTYDIARKENFTMRAALTWTINDFPTYSMLSSWSTHVYYVPYPSHDWRKRGWCSAIKTKPTCQIEKEVPDTEVPYQDDEMSHVPEVIEVDPVTSLVDKDNTDDQIDAEVLIELLRNNNNNEDANNFEDNEEDRHIHEEDNEDDTYYHEDE
ncbi:hypothetical protein TSUD_408300 [Trifolium subterraneum]|uniref:Transposase-associated domain-containing protein n=1 Tax=Trifolium subterraneum TaxID=3900 RepID=A0A2Z6PRL4_TRISU|nr:hypothetical protein TSUD_408300 [Trifolium subterraneum]